MLDHLEKALNDSICRHFVGLMWLDRTALNFTESDLTGTFFWTELYSNWWHRTALAGMHCTALLQLAYIDLVCSGWKYTAMYLHGWDLTWVDGTGLDWTGVSGTGLHWTRQRYTSLHWIAVDCAWLHQTALHCTVLDWTRNHHTG